MGQCYHYKAVLPNDLRRANMAHMISEYFGVF